MKQVINVARNDFQNSLSKQNASKWLENHPTVELNKGPSSLTVHIK